MTMSHNIIKSFDKFINESNNSAYTLKDLSDLLEVGLLTKSDIINILLDDSFILLEACPELFYATKSNEYANLIEAGFIPRATIRQLLKNKTIGFYTQASSGHNTIYVYHRSKTIRRVPEYGISTLLLRNIPGEGRDFYINSFKWILKNINPNSSKLYNFKTQ